MYGYTSIDGYREIMEDVLVMSQRHPNSFKNIKTQIQNIKKN
jgi:hypothetical protein